MLYVCEKKDGKFGVKNTQDSSIKYYTMEELDRFRKSTRCFILGQLRRRGYVPIDLTEYQTLDAGEYLIFSFVNASANKICVGIEKKDSGKIEYAIWYKTYFSRFPDELSDSDPKNGELQWVFEEGKNNKCLGFCVWLRHKDPSEGSSVMFPKGRIRDDCLEFFVEIFPDGTINEVKRSDGWDFDETSPEPIYDEETDSITFRSMSSMSAF